MTRLRRALGSVAVVWLCCQVGTVAIVPIALWASTADPHQAAECTCGHDAGTMCPMHRHTRAGDTSKQCAMRAANESGAAALTAILGVSGLTPLTAAALVAPPSTMRVTPDETDVRGERPVPPDPPPPRV